jgi:hypothetical protein
MPFIVPIMEYEKGWGSKVDDRIYFRDGDKAHEFKNTFNSRNTEKSVPDIYWVANDPYHIESSKVPEGTVFHDDPKS